MLRALTVLFVLVFVAASGMTAQTLTSNGDTGLIVVETVICVALLSGALYCRRRREMLTE